MRVLALEMRAPVTKHSDEFFERTRQGTWIDAVTTPVDKTQMNLCVLIHLFLEGVQQQKNRLEMLFPMRNQCHVFKFCGGHHKIKYTVFP